MAGKSRKSAHHIVDTAMLLLLLALVLFFCQYRRGVQAAGDEPADGSLPAVGSGRSHTRNRAVPAATPRPRRTSAPAPLPALDADEKIWVAKGEVVGSGNFFVCRAVCRPPWEGRVFDILQATRGTEDWIPQNDHFVRCIRNNENSHLTGGLWQTPPENPETSLCFLVIRQSEVPSEP
ncbi:MAG: hypothetical protein EBR09_14040 [Proteobacteria bacterium]|nr:hypothetical protein [Pseudomonadota bacterium]